MRLQPCWGLSEIGGTQLMRPSCNWVKCSRWLNPAQMFCWFFPIFTWWKKYMGSPIQHYSYSRLLQLCYDHALYNLHKMWGEQSFCCSSAPQTHWSAPVVRSWFLGSGRLWLPSLMRNGNCTRTSSLTWKTTSTRSASANSCTATRWENNLENMIHFW